MAFTILKPSEFQTAQRGRVVIYGENGTGKSTLAATMPGRVLLASAKYEILVPYAERVKSGEIIPVLIEDWDGLVDLYLILRKKPAGEYTGLALDTYTRLLIFALEKVSGVKRDPADAAKFLKNPPTTARDWRVWSDVGFLGLEMAKNLLDLPMDVLFLCQEDTYHPKFEQDILTTGPDLAGNMAWKGLKDIVQIIARLYVTDASGGLATGDANSREIDPNRKEQRNLLVGKHDRFFTKGNTARLGYVLENPTWGKIATSWKESSNARMA